MKLKNLGYAALVTVATAAFVLGTAGSSEAAKMKKAKKMAAPPPPHAAICFVPPAGPVCATKGGMKFTYANSCYAAYDGAKVVSQKACPVKKVMKSGKKKAKKAMKKAAKKPMKKK